MKKLFLLLSLVSGFANAQVYLGNQANCYYEVVFEGQYYCTNDPSYYGYQGYAVYSGGYYGGYYPGNGYYNNNLRQDAQNAYNNNPQFRNDVNAAAQNPAVRQDAQNVRNQINSNYRENINVPHDVNESFHGGGRR